MAQQRLTDFQIAVAHVFFRLKESQRYFVAGGAALLASELINRPTHDLDLFTHHPVESVTAAKDAFLKEINRRGWTAAVIHDSPTFCRLVVSGFDEVLVDLAVDSPPSSRPKMTLLGPTLAPLELAARKLLDAQGDHRARASYDGRMALNLFAGIPVTDYKAALTWYEQLLGSPPAFIPNDIEAVWELAEHRFVFIEQRPEDAGHAMHTVFVDNLDALVAQIAERGLEPAERETYSNGVRKITYRDPDGNEIGFGGDPL